MPLEQVFQRPLLQVGLHKEPVRFEMFLTNVSVLEMR